jgi:hypothetical protein
MRPEHGRRRLLLGQRGLRRRRLEPRRHDRARARRRRRLAQDLGAPRHRGRQLYPPRRRRRHDPLRLGCAAAAAAARPLLVRAARAPRSHAAARPAAARPAPARAQGKSPITSWATVSTLSGRRILRPCPCARAWRPAPASPAPRPRRATPKPASARRDLQVWQVRSRLRIETPPRRAARAGARPARPRRRGPSTRAGSRPRLSALPPLLPLFFPSPSLTSVAAPFSSPPQRGARSPAPPTAGRGPLPPCRRAPHLNEGHRLEESRCTRAPPRERPALTPPRGPAARRPRRSARTRPPRRPT